MLRLEVVLTAFVVGCCAVLQADAWSGHYETYYVRESRSYHRNCGFLGWSRCTRYYYVTVPRHRCQTYWTYHGHDYMNCNKPICTTPCYNGGTCYAPNSCNCTQGHKGMYCTELKCSHLYTCYPGACRDTNPPSCSCTDGFSGQHCMNMTATKSAKILGCDLTLANIRRTDNKQMFYYSGPCAINKTGADVMWSNQALFNYAQFSMRSLLDPLYLPPRPSYVTNSRFGITSHRYRVKHTKIKRNGVSGTFVALDKTYNCPDNASYESPVEHEAECKVTEQNYKISIEDGDIFSVTYKTQGGGFSEIKNLDTDRFYQRQKYEGMEVDKTIEFHFDFIAPVHCSETTTRCPTTNEPIQLQKDITNLPLSPRWSGWSDDRAGLDYYKLEIFKLEPNINGELVEMKPLAPVFHEILNDTSSPAFPTYKPSAPGMYSILLQASDKANNSKIARRLVLYDNSSNITLTTPPFNVNKTSQPEMHVGDGGMHVTTAISETGFMWQTGTPGRRTKVTLDWTGHFVNKIHEEGKLLNKVLSYPTQFQDLSDSGILRSEKVVAPKLDDNTGMRTKSAIPNINGITQFEFCKITTSDREKPTSGWTTLPLEEMYTFEQSLDDGQYLRLWVRATDIMNHTKADYTEVHIDNTPPVVSPASFKPNLKNDTYVYTSRVIFSASDAGSGVHRLDYKLRVENSTRVLKKGTIGASRNNETGACRTYPECKCVLANECFLLNQSIPIDNCWFMVPQDSLEENGTIEVSVYNQALLKKSFTIDVGMLRHLNGLEEYSGPTNIHVAKKLSNGVRLAWDLPKTASCYGRMEITIVLLLGDGSTRVQHVHQEATFVDIVGLNSDQAYNVKLNLGYQGTAFSALSYQFQTAPPENYLSGGIIAGITAGVLAVVAILIAVFVVLLRRGHMQPVRRGLRAMTVKVRQTRRGKDNPGYFESPNRQESIYMYGEMDFNTYTALNISRADVVFDSLLTSGNFALIYKARITNTKKCTDDVVVAKTLKAGFTENDELLMKAKINFMASEAFSHENVLRFLGAVVNDSDIGPFMLSEHCEQGPLNKYLEENRNNVTMELQENLFRFGLGVARGMQYLVTKKIVHRRLAARNILLDKALLVKITGFGPLPTETEGDTSGKRERIPIKWVAPECMKSSESANEKSDMWSFGVVLWEIFSLGEAPYGKVKGSELPAKLKTGTRLSKPENADDKWYAMMQRTWQYEPRKRPSFAEVGTELDQLFVTAPQDDYYYYRR